MFLESVTICVVVISTVVWFLQSSTAKKVKLPPGPWGLPLIGHLGFLGTEPQKTLANWAKTYGPILYCKFGSFPTVVLSDANVVKKMFALSETAARPEIPAILQGVGGKKGILFSEGTINQEQRQFAMRAMKDHGIGKKAMAERIHGDLSEFLQKLEESAGQPITSKRLFNTNIINSLWSIVMTERMDSKRLMEITTILQDKVSRLGSVVSQLAMYMPWIENLTRILTLGTYSLTAERVNGFKELFGYMNEQLVEHQQSWQKGQPRDVMDAYFDRVADTTDSQSSFHKSRDMAKNFTGDLFMGGVETTSSSLEWMLKKLAGYPGVQKKLQDEIDQVVGNDRPPTTTDKNQMPYAEAVLHELLRMAVILPFSVQHTALTDFTFEGCHIPKGTMILSNLYAVHRDDKVFSEPHAFKPERWLETSQDEDLVKHLVAFGCGKRSCVGEALARDQLWLYMTNIFQRYNVTFADPRQPKILQRFGLGVTLLPFKVVFQSR